MEKPRRHDQEPMSSQESFKFIVGLIPGDYGLKVFRNRETGLLIQVTRLGANEEIQDSRLTQVQFDRTVEDSKSVMKEIFHLSPKDNIVFWRSIIDAETLSGGRTMFFSEERKFTTKTMNRSGIDRLADLIQDSDRVHPYHIDKTLPFSDETREDRYMEQATGVIGRTMKQVVGLYTEGVENIEINLDFDEEGPHTLVTPQE